jgi:hypothetical protein
MGPSKTEVDIIAANQEAIDRAKRLYVAVTISQQRVPTKFGSLYERELAKVVKPSPVADAVNPTPSMPHDELLSSWGGLTSDYKGVLFNVKNVKKDSERQEEPQSQGPGPSSSGG